MYTEQLKNIHNELRVVPNEFPHASCQEMEPASELSIHPFFNLLTEVTQNFNDGYGRNV